MPAAAVIDTLDLLGRAGRCAWSGSCDATPSASPSCATDRRQPSVLSQRLRELDAAASSSRPRRRYRLTAAAANRPGSSTSSIAGPSRGARARGVYARDRERARVERRLQELRFGGKPLRHRVPLLRRAAAQAGAEASAAGRRGWRRSSLAAGAAPRLGRGRLEGFEPGRPYATIAVIAASAVLLLVERQATSSLYDLGAIAGAGRRRVVALPGRAIRLHRHRLPVRGRSRAGAVRARPRASPRQRRHCGSAARLRGARNAGRRRR